MDNHSRRDSNRRHDARRGSARERGYTKRWERARLLFLMQNPFCRMCEQEGPPNITAATVVDHIVAHRGDPVLFWDPDNGSPYASIIIVRISSASSG